MSKAFEGIRRQMSTSSGNATPDSPLTCLSCGEEFLSYREAGELCCPHCGEAVDLTAAPRARPRMNILWLALGIAALATACAVIFAIAK